MAASSRRLGRGGGSVIGGRATLAIDPGALRHLAAGHASCLVSGTNGKTTTTSLLRTALATAGPVVTNLLGANLPPGLVAALATAEPGAVAALEVDEAWLGRVIEATDPAAVVLLNLSRDQLDRNNEVRTLATVWRHALADRPTTVVIANADDPLVVWGAGTAQRVVWVGAGQPWTADAAGCPACGGRITFLWTPFRVRPGKVSKELVETGQGGKKTPAADVPPLEVVTPSARGLDVARLAGGQAPPAVVVPLEVVTPGAPAADGSLPAGGVTRSVPLPSGAATPSVPSPRGAATPSVPSPRGDAPSAGGWACSSCDFRRPALDVWLDGDAAVIGGRRIPLHLALPGRANRSNATMALTAAGELGVDVERAAAAMPATDEVVGRYRTVTVGGISARMLLAKNPAGWLEVLDVVRPAPQPVVVVINARIADGRDPSWLWDVPFERLAGRLVVASGERGRDLAVRLQYAEVDQRYVSDPVEAVEVAAAAARQAGRTDIDVVANYTSFQTLRARLP